jgi:hypothetical protein
MGNTISENVVNTAIEAMMSVVNSSAQSCSQKYQSSQSLNISGNTVGGNIIVSNTELDSFNVISSSCSQSISNDTNLKAEIQETVDQLAKSISVGSGLSSTDAENVTNALISMSQNIINETYQSCATAVSQTQGVNISNNNVGGNIQVSGLKFSTQNQTLAKCAQNGLNKSSEALTIQLAIKQKATAVTVGLMAIMIIGLVVAMLIFVVGITKGLTNPAFILMIVALTCIIAGIVIIAK